MLSNDLTSRVRRNVFGGYRLKKKHLREIVQKFEVEEQKQQQLAEYMASLENSLKLAEEQNQQKQNRIGELFARLNDANTVLTKERELNAKHKREYHDLARKFDDLEVKAAKDYTDALVVQSRQDEELRQLQAASAKLSEDHKLQLYQQQQDCDRKCAELEHEKAASQIENAKLLKDLDAVYDAQNKTEKRRKQLESELNGCKLALEKETQDRLEMEGQLKRLKNEHKVNVQDLTSQLETAKQQEKQALEDLDNLNSQTMDSSIDELKTALSGSSSEERIDESSKKSGQ